MDLHEGKQRPSDATLDLWAAAADQASSQNETSLQKQTTRALYALAELLHDSVTEAVMKRDPESLRQASKALTSLQVLLPSQK